MHRGARREPVFKEDTDCAYFLGLLDDVVTRFGLEVHGFALMPNHYHLLVRSVKGNLSRATKHLNQMYVQYLNRKYKWDGPVFRGRFRSQLVGDERQLPYVLSYIHLNPLKANLITRLDGTCWTSHSTYMGSTTYSEWLTTSFFEELFESSEALQNYMLDLHRGVSDWPEAMVLTSGLFKARASSSARDLAGAEVPMIPPTEALARVCATTGVDEQQLRTSVVGRGANPARRFAVWALSRHTSLTQQQIGRELLMSTAQVANVLRHLRQRTSDEIKGWQDGWSE